MSLAEPEIANVEGITRAQSRFGGTPLQQFARAGLALSIVDFRRMCSELAEHGFDDGSPHDISDTLFNWMTEKLDVEQSK